jgi:hypothetical protein
MNGYPDLPPHPPSQGQDAGRAFLSGFAGCLGVGLAIVFVIVLLLVLVALGHHG